MSGGLASMEVWRMVWCGVVDGVDNRGEDRSFEEEEIQYSVSHTIT